MSRARRSGPRTPPATTPPAVEIVTIGDELLLGDRVDGNAAWLGSRLAAEGIRVLRRTTVGDDAAAIEDAVRGALERVAGVLCTGGLGPTPDDLTRPAVARVFGRTLRTDPAVLEAIHARFRERGLEPSSSNRVQAEVPDGAVVFQNRRGTAPGLALEDERGRFAVLLPGVPHEMRGLVEEAVLPYLRARWPGGGRPIRHRVLRTTGIPESTLADRLADLLPTLPPLAVAFLPGAAGVDVRLTSWGELDKEAAERALDAAEAAVRERVGHRVYGTGSEDLVDAVARLLGGRGLTLAVAESCTGGLLGKRITDRPGASGYFLGGVIAYADAIKEALLGVPADTLRARGAVSEETVRAMARGALEATGAAAALAVTGIAGPAGGTPAKPVGTVWLAAAAGGRLEVRRLRLGGDRDEIRERAAQAALALLWILLRDDLTPRS